MSGTKLMTVRSGKWKLHVEKPPIWPKHLKGDWVDPRAPDGVTILAPCEQATPDDHPDVLTGDPAEPMMLFDLEADRAEQHNVAQEHPEVVARLKSLFDENESGHYERQDHRRTVPPEGRHAVPAP